MIIQINPYFPFAKICKTTKSNITRITRTSLVSNYHLQGLRHWLKSEYALNGLNFQDIGDLGHPDYLAPGRLLILSRSIEIFLSSIYADDDHFRSNSCTEKNPGNIAIILESFILSIKLIFLTSGKKI